MLIAGVVTAMWASSGWGETVAVEWSDLVDRSAQVFEDPYAALSGAQMQTLISVVRLRADLAGDQLAQDERAEVRARLRESEDALEKDGIDIDWLISQRWIVAERRERAAWAGNGALDGETVTLSGFIIPAPRDEDGAPSAYLVPERGMCSHTPPPAPNQMVRLRLNEGWAPSALYEPIVVQGALSLVPSRRDVVVVDGPVPMHAAFALDVQKVETAGQVRAPAAPNNAWVEQMKEKLRAAGQEMSDGN